MTASAPDAQVGWDRCAGRRHDGAGLLRSLGTGRRELRETFYQVVELRTALGLEPVDSSPDEVDWVRQHYPELELRRLFGGPPYEFLDAGAEAAEVPLRSAHQPLGGGAPPLMLQPEYKARNPQENRNHICRLLYRDADGREYTRATGPEAERLLRGDAATQQPPPCGDAAAAQRRLLGVRLPQRRRRRRGHASATEAPLEMPAPGDWLQLYTEQYPLWPTAHAQVLEEYHDGRRTTGRVLVWLWVGSAGAGAGDGADNGSSPV